MKKPWFSKRVVIYEIIGLLFIIIVLWVDEILDIPHYLFGAIATPVNWVESLIETIVTLTIGGLLIFMTNKLFKRVRHLEGLLPICAVCKKIRDDNDYWRQAEIYIAAHSDAEFSHSLCPDCAKELYPEYTAKIK